MPLTWLRLHQTNHAINQRPWREVLSCTRLFLGRIFLQKTFVQIAEAFLACREPVELIDCRCQRLQVGRLSQLQVRFDHKSGMLVADLSGYSDQDVYAEAARRRIAKREYNLACECGKCANCKQREYRRSRRAAGKDK